MKKNQLFAYITKVDSAKREVYGVLAEERPDKDGEIFDYSTSRPYFQKWNDTFSRQTKGKSVGNLRAMHSAISAGKFVTMAYNDQDKQIEVCAKVVDDKEWKKVMEGVYTGFSIGARVVGKKWTDGQHQRYTADPYEGSLVDNPAMYGATFTAIKSDGSTEKRKFKSSEGQMTLEERMNKFFDSFESRLDAVLKGYKAKDDAEEADEENADAENADAENADAENADEENADEENTDGGGKGSSEGRKPSRTGGRASGAPRKQPAGIGARNGGAGSRGSRQQNAPMKPPRKMVGGDDDAAVMKFADIEKMVEERIEKVCKSYDAAFENILKAIELVAKQPIPLQARVRGVAVSKSDDGVDAAEVAKRKAEEERRKNMSPEDRSAAIVKDIHAGGGKHLLDK